MAQGRSIRVLLILMLTLSGALTPFASAQDTPPPPQAQPALCFDRDARIAGACRGDTPPNYLQGEEVIIDIEAVAGVNLFVSVRCPIGCPVSDPSASRAYWAVYRGSALVFPRDFAESGPDGSAYSAVADKAGRYNSTWEVTAHFTGAPITRSFRVWLYDAFTGSNNTVRPGELHLLRASGFSLGAEVSMSLERRDPASGRYGVFSTMAGVTGLSGPFAGVVERSFRLPPTDAQHIALCGGALKDCYRIVVSGPGKESEVVPMQVGYADITRGDTTPRQAASTLPTLQRTQNATFDIDLYYPGGRLHLGAKLQPSDLAVNPAFREKALRVAVEKVFPNQSIESLDDIPLRYEASAYVWRATWTIPKDIAIENDGVRYRLRLVDQRDAFGNRIREDILGNFTVARAQIAPRVIDFPVELERTELGVVRVAVLYYNGSPFSVDDALPGNQSPFKGCFLRVPEDPPAPAPTSPRLNRCGPDDPLAWGTYFDGAWNFTVRYPRDHAQLGLYRFAFENGTTDRHGNSVIAQGEADYNRNFQLIPASPLVTFATVMRGAESPVLERGNQVYVSATIKYHDGSAYDHTRRANPNSTGSSTLSGLLIRRGPSPSGTGYGPIAAEEVFNLTEVDASSGRWGGFLQLTDDDTATPAGIWTFRFDVADNLTVANVNRTAFDREVVATTIVLCPTSQPSASVPTGSPVKFRFKLFYSECDKREVVESAVLSKISARIYRFDTARQTTTGDPLSNVLVPSFSRESTRDWGIEYEVANHLFGGSYAFLVTASDTFGNKLLPNARSKPFTTYTEIVERSVITQPPLEIARGESATVVFDAREGDTGVDPSRFAPRIQLERFDMGATGCEDAVAERGCWVREISDVRLFDPTFSDHLGVFPIDVDTPVGLYRFSLQGRDSTFHIITGLSQNFTVSPTEVGRGLLTTPPERVVKGQPFTFFIEQLPGDKLNDRAVFLDGRPIRIPNPILRSEGDRVNVTWAIPFEAPAGNYTLRIRGTDVSGNNIFILTSPISALSATLEGRMLGQPVRLIERGEEAKIQFAVSYPDGSFYAAPEVPVVFVRNATGVVATATLRREGLSFAATWRSPSGSGVGDYYFEVSPQSTGGTGNAFPPLRSNTFRVAPGIVQRPAIDQIGATLERFVSAIYSAPFESDDKYVSFDLVYYGPERGLVADAEQVEITRSPLPHTLDPIGGKYVARLVTDQQSQTGVFRIEMNGEDGQGNRIIARSRFFVIRSTVVVVQFDSPPPQSEFGDEKTVTLSFLAKYSIGTIMDESYGRPGVVLLYNSGGGERPVSQRPELQYLEGRWYMTWAAPDNLPDGSYTFAVGGEDLHGNRISSARSAPYLITTDLSASFAKAVPGPSPVLLALVVVALAFALAQYKKRA